MNKYNSKKAGMVSMILALMLCLTACGNNEKNPTETMAPTTTPSKTHVVELIPEVSASPFETSNPSFKPTDVSISVIDGLTDEQRNSIGMLNYLTLFTQEINSSKNSRMYLETAYSSLINNTYPNAVDQDTHFQLVEILDRLEEYRLNAVKRERLEYIYEQNKAQAIRSAIPNPMGLLSAVGSFNWIQLATSVAYMAVDSITSYQSASSQADLQYLQDGWELDDAEAATLHKLRTNAFSYMLDMVNTYSLPGDYALNEAAITNFVNWKMDSNIVRRIQLLEASNNTYKGFGPYWLVLAESYYQNGDYQKCVNAIASYEALSTRIFRQDYELANVLPIALISAMEVKNGDDYIITASHYLDLIDRNAAYDNWSLRYFAAQGYIDLYKCTGNDEYLNRAYGLLLNNVTLLVSNQIEQNETYLVDVKKVSIPSGSTEAKRKEIDNLNKQAEENRKTALPPVSEPLILNCDLLFALADKLQIPPSEQRKIEQILHDNGQPLFLIPSLDNQYWFDKKDDTIATDLQVSFDGKTLKLPAFILSDYASIVMTVTSEEGIVTFDDWVVSNVERKEKGNIDSFVVSMTSKQLSSFNFKNGMNINLSTNARANSQSTTYQFNFTVGEEHTLWIFPYLVYTRTE